MVTAKHTHASTITYPVSMPISYKVFGKYKNIVEKNQSTDTLNEFFNYSNRTCFLACSFLSAHIFTVQYNVNAILYFLVSFNFQP